MEYIKQKGIRNMPRTLTKKCTIYSPRIRELNFKSNDGLFSIEYGLMHFEVGYIWNGCDVAKDWVSTDRGSASHDALIKYTVPVSNKVIDKVFYDLLKEDGFKLALVYYLAVRIASKFNRRRFHGI